MVFCQQRARRRCEEGKGELPSAVGVSYHVSGPSVLYKAGYDFICI